MGGRLGRDILRGAPYVRELLASKPRRCVLLFARSARAEARAKGLRGAECLFTRTAERVRATVDALVGVDLVVVGSAAGVRADVALPQRGLTLADRLTAAFEDVFRLGYGQIVAVGLDSPGLASAHLRTAWRILDSGRPVLGPCDDGGVYLVGLSRSHASGLSGVPWGTDRVGRMLRRALPESVLLGRLADVDRPGDLRAAARSLPRDAVLFALAGHLTRVRPAVYDRRPAETQIQRLPNSRAPPPA